MKYMRNIVAVFDQVEDARRASAALERQGVPASRVRLLSASAFEERDDIVEKLVGAGVQLHHAIRYEWALRHGKTLLMTTVGSAKAARVARVLSLCHPIERVTAA